MELVNQGCTWCSETQLTEHCTDVQLAQKYCWTWWLAWMIRKWVSFISCHSLLISQALQRLWKR